MTLIDNNNKLALSYAISCTPRIKEICKPLQDYLGIIGFGYLRVYSDCSYLALMNGYEEYHTKHIETVKAQDQAYIDSFRSTESEEPNFFLWPTKYNILPKVVSLRKEFNIWGGFAIQFRNKRYIEDFSFWFNNNVDDKASFYIQNSQTLTKFCDYFKIQAADLINCNNKSKLAMYEDKFDISYIKKQEEDRKKFFNEINSVKNYRLINKSGNLVSLTQREYDCVSILMQNRTMKEIGKVLDLSPRTVEHYIQNVKQKLEVNYKSQLVDIFSNSHIR